MANEANARVIKTGKYTISIAFPEGTRGTIQEHVPVAELLKLLEGSGKVSVGSTFPLNAPVPI